MRRAAFDNSSYSSCHSDGPLDGAICTAVTLYSGQFVAQSETSVVVHLCARVVEGRVDHARRHAIGDQRPQGGLAGTACDLHPVAVPHAAVLGVEGMDLETIRLVPDHVGGAPRLRAHMGIPDR